MSVLDAFPFAGSPTELLLLQCRLTELYDVVDRFVIVEAKVDHQDKPKPLNYLEHEDEFGAWADKITYVVADSLPTLADDEWTWAREHAQREYIAQALEDAGDDDIVMQSDLDEIPRPVVVRNLRLAQNRFVSFRQKGHFWAVDWLYPDPPGWSGTVAATVGTLRRLPVDHPFVAMRNSRNLNVTQLGNAGWHFSWLGRAGAARQKVGSFCHPEVAAQMVDDYDWYWREGWHVGGGENGKPVKMLPVDVDRTYPAWIQDGANVPDDWYRPR